MLDSKGLRDVYREHHPREKIFTRFDKASGVYTRLDRWYAPSGGEYQYTTGKDLSFNQSDHDAVWLTSTHITAAPRWSGTHRINHKVLEHPKVRQKVIKTINEIYSDYSMWSEADKWELMKRKIYKILKYSSRLMKRLDKQTLADAILALETF